MNIIEKFIQGLVPFLMLGVILAIVVAGIILFSYLLLWGAIIGLVIYAIAAIKQNFFSGNNATSSVSEQRLHKPQTYDHEKY